jgi:predicted alpha/beta hydrolase
VREHDERRVTLADGRQIVARVFTPEGAPKAAVLVVPAMGVSQRFYEPFASWLADQGFLAATFDYRGMGLSRSGPLRELDVDLVSWARLDCAAMIDLLAARAPGLPLCWIGHSLGGQILPFVPNRERVARVVTVAAGSGYWLENTPLLRSYVWWLWFFVVPVAVRVAGYFPGRTLRKVGDLPRGVMEQWRRWCLDREYAVGAEGPEVRGLYAAVATPITSLSFTDDEYMSARNIASLHSFYTGAPRTMKRFAPRDLGLRRVGHFGFFRKDHAEALWRPHLLPELAVETVSFGSP